MSILHSFRKGREGRECREVNVISSVLLCPWLNLSISILLPLTPSHYLADSLALFVYVFPSLCRRGGKERRAMVLYRLLLFPFVWQKAGKEMGRVMVERYRSCKSWERGAVLERDGATGLGLHVRAKTSEWKCSHRQNGRFLTIEAPHRSRINPGCSAELTNLFPVLHKRVISVVR